MQEHVLNGLWTRERSQMS